MKKIVLILLCIIMLWSIASCGSSDVQNESMKMESQSNDVNTRMTNEELVDILFDEEYVRRVQEETIYIPGVESEYKFLYISDLHLIVQNEEVSEESKGYVEDRYKSFVNKNGRTSEEIYVKLMENLKKTDIDAILMGGDMMDYLSKANWELLKSELDKVNKPYLFATADHDVCTWWTNYTEEEAALLKSEMNINLINILEYDEFIILSIGENTSQITDSALEEIKTVFAMGKPIIIMTHVPFDSLVDEGLGEESMKVWNDRKLMWGEGCYYVPNANTQALIDMIHAENTPVVAVLAGHLHFDYTCMINDNVKQYVFKPGYKGRIMLFTVKGVE